VEVTKPISGLLKTQENTPFGLSTQSLQIKSITKKRIPLVP
jgi:hypothetical protein